MDTVFARVWFSVSFTARNTQIQAGGPGGSPGRPIVGGPFKPSIFPVSAESKCIGGFEIPVSRAHRGSKDQSGSAIGLGLRMMLTFIAPQITQCGFPRHGSDQGARSSRRFSLGAFPSLPRGLSILCRGRDAHRAFVGTVFAAPPTNLRV